MHQPPLQHGTIKSYTMLFPKIINKKIWTQQKQIIKISVNCLIVSNNIFFEKNIHKSTTCNIYKNISMHINMEKKTGSDNHIYNSP